MISQYHILNRLKIKRDLNQQDLNNVNLHFSNLKYFYSLEVVDRVSETQLQVSGKFNKIIWQLKGLPARVKLAHK